MKKVLSTSFYLLLVTNSVFLLGALRAPMAVQVVVFLLSLLFFVYLNLRSFSPAPALSMRLQMLERGSFLLLVSLIVTFCNTVLLLVSYFYFIPPLTRQRWLVHAGACVLATLIVVLGGIIRVYTASTQLEIWRRVFFALFWWVPVLSFVVGLSMYRFAKEELRLESEKFLKNSRRKDFQVCKTRYPLLLVHGVFFRDSHYFNYWGRIPAELESNGATIFYGEQPSADSVAKCGGELAQRIRDILERSGAEKLNVIAHSKGGLDMRYALTHQGVAPYVATLTTINTPHQGCEFVDYLLARLSPKTIDAIAGRYNQTLRELGEEEPDFLIAVEDLTSSFCQHFNQQTPDCPEVVYRSVGSVLGRRSKRKRFPYNFSHGFVRQFDGANDGLVSVESMKWGDDFYKVEAPVSRGVSHGDMTDLFRENISDFDVREFYVQLVAQLKEKGF